MPTPPRGYWAKKEAGQPVKQTKFHETTDQQGELIVIHASRSNLAPEVLQILEQEKQRRKSRSAANQPVEPVAIEPVEDVHPVMAATAKALRKTKPDKDDAVQASGAGLCGVVVGLASREQAIYILDKLVRLLDGRGLKVEPADTCIRVVATEPDALTFSLVERIDRRTHVATVDELKKEEQLRKKQERDSRFGIWSYSSERAYPEFDFVRTGELSIQIKDQYIKGLRRSWNDGRRQKLETLIDDIVSGIIAYLAGVEIDRREKREAWQREWQRKEQLYALASARQARETSRAKFLQDLIKVSTQADELRSFVTRLRERMPTSPSGELQRLTD